MTDPISPLPTHHGPLRVNTPEDLLAGIPLVLGFPPTSSVVLMTFAGARQPSARVDLPADPGDIPEVVQVLVGAMSRNGARRVAAVLYDGDARLVDTLGAALVDACTEAGIEVIECLAVTDGRYRSMLPGRLGPAEGTAFDVSDHPFVAEGVLAGRVPYASREELASTLDTDEAAAGRVAARLSRGSLATGRDRAASTAWAMRQVGRWMSARSVPTDDEVARLLVDLLDLAVRDGVWRLLTRATCRAWVELWSDVARRSPSALVAAPVTLVGFGAWVSGDGALAWCAVDRALAASPGYSAAALLGDLLQSAASPDMWEAVQEAWGPSHNPA